MKKISAVILGLLLTAPAFAGGGPLPEGPYVIVDGRAEVQAAPDLVVIHFTIGKTEPTTSEAAAYVEDWTRKLLALVRKYGVADDDIRASAVDVDTEYDYQSGNRKLQGQNVRREIKVTLRDLSKYGALIQELLARDVSGLDGADFDSTRHLELQKQAINEAIDDAHAQAEAAAKRTGATLDKVYAVSVGNHDSFLGRDFPLGDSSSVMLGSTAQLGRDASTFMVPKTVSFSASVTAVYSIKPNP